MTKLKLMACGFVSTLFLQSCSEVLEPVSFFGGKQGVEAQSVQEDFGTYKFVFVAGALDDNSGTFAGGSLYVDNIAIDRARLLPAQQHLISQISVLSVAEAENATDVLSYSMEQTSKNRAELGALINRYSSAIDGYSMMGLNMRQARSRIKDTEYTVETSKLAKQQILAQASMAMLAQANTSKNAVLELIR